MLTEAFVQFYIVALSFTFCTAVIALPIFLQRRKQPGATPFAMLMICIMLWMAGYVFELLGTTYETKLFWFNVRQTGITFVAPVFWLTAYEYNYRQRGAPLKYLIPIFGFGALTTLMIWTSQWHRALRASIQPVPVGDTWVIDTAGGWFYWIETAVYLVIVVITVALLMDAYRRTQRRYRGQIVMIMLPLLIPYVFMIIDGIGLNPIAPLGLATLSLSGSAIIGVLALRRYQLFEVVPIAHDKILASLRSGVLVTDRKLRIVDINAIAAAIIAPGRTPESLTGQPISAVLTTYPEWLATYDQQQDSDVTIQVTDPAQDVYYDITISPIRDRRKALIGYLSVIVDMTAYKKAEEQARALAIEREKIRMMEHFLRDVSHDLNTPIAVIYTTGYVTERYGEKAMRALAALEADPNLTAETRANVRIVQDALTRISERVASSTDAGKRLGLLVQGMLEVARLERDLTLRSEPHDLNAIVTDLIERRRKESASRSIVIEFTPDAGLPKIAVDIGEIGRAIDQVLVNAINFTDDGGQIQVRTCREDGHALVEIRDAGSGIDAADLPHVFEQFFRADRARAAHRGGAGLGLPIARRIVEAHRGTIDLESTLGEGTTARIRLPLPEEMGMPAPVALIS
ncbi:hypothetical protein FBR02_14170 [Anaerolineae bacterium CFX9]|nr:hypothetical protein [Anaerolineae bacterium CFX9]